MGKPVKAEMFSAKTQNTFWSRVEKLGPDDCWPWKGHLLESGYGDFCTVDQTTGKTRLFRANRVAFALSKGPLRAEDLSQHSCDHPPCCNPAHLSKGTPLSNMQDKITKNRAKYVPVPKTLDKKKVILARELLKSFSQTKVALMVGCSQGMVSRISTGKAWTHVEA